MKRICLLLGVLLLAGGSLDNETLNTPGTLSGGVLGSGALMPPGGALPVATYYDRNFRTQAASVGTIPTCSAATNCVMQCTAAVSGAWNCVDETGAAIGVTAGTGAISYTSPYGTALDYVTVARAPKLTTPTDVLSTVASTNDWTVVVSASTGNTGATAWTVSDIDGTSGDYIYQRTLGSQWECRAGTADAKATDTQRLRGTRGGFALHACVWDTSAGTMYAYSGGDSASSAGAYTAPSGSVDWPFGRGSTYHGSGFPLNGALHSYTLFSDAKSATWVDEANIAFYGAAPDGAEDAFFSERAGTGYFLPSATGRLENHSAEIGLVDSDNGLWFDPGGFGLARSGCAWAADCLDANSWTAIGTPTVTQNVDRGPFADWAAGDTGNEADLIVDDDGAASEGLLGTLNCADTLDTGWYNASCYVRSGTSGTVTDEVRVGITTDATGSTDCTFTGLTSTFERVTCPAQITGSPTSIKGRILVGDADADTGSVIVSQCQCEPHYAPSAPKPQDITTNVVPEDQWVIPASETTTWPDGVTDGGDVEVVFRLAYPYPSKARHIEMMVDVANTGDTTVHSLLLFLGGVEGSTTPIFSVATYDEVTAGADCLDEGEPSTDTDYTMSGDLSADTWYVARFVYTPTGTSGGFPRVSHKLYWDTCADPDTCHATTLRVTETGKCAPQLNAGGGSSHDLMYFGRRSGPGAIRRWQGGIARLSVKGTTPGGP